jgi:hypothetical protein
VTAEQLADEFAHIYWDLAEIEKPDDHPWEDVAEFVPKVVADTFQQMLDNETISTP